MSKTPEWLVSPREEMWQRLFAVKSNHRSLFRTTRNTRECIAPDLHGDGGIWSDDPRYHRVLIRCAESLSSSHVPVIDSDGFSDHRAIVSDFQSLRNPSGYYMNPISIPLENNEVLVDELKLATGFLNPRDEKIFNELHKYMLQTVVPASLSIRKTASSGAPYFEASLNAKKEPLAVMNQYSPDILRRFGAGDLTGLFDDYGLFFATYMGVRTQPDSFVLKDGQLVPKPREVNDEEFVRTGGRSGHRFNADKTVYRSDGTAINGLAANRRRSVYAYPSMYNYWLTQFFTVLRAHYLEDAAFTFKHRSPKEIVEKLSGFKSVRGYDVKQFDQSVQGWLLSSFVDAFSGFLKDEVLFFFDKVLKQPIFMPHPQVLNARGYEEKPHEFNPCFGDPGDLATFTRVVGIPSGIGPNPDIGKFIMTFVYLCLFDRHFGDVLETGIRTILRGEHDRYALLDMTDDAVIGVNDESFWATVDRVVKEPFYVKLEAEEGISFLGNILYKDRTGKLSATSNVVTFLRNRLCPEHGVQHWTRREFAGTGWIEGKKHYSSAPLFGDVWNAFEDIWRSEFGESIDVRFRLAFEAERHRGVPSLSEIDRAVLENPDKLYYRYSIDEIHPWVRDKLVGSVAFEEFFPSIERYFL